MAGNTDFGPLRRQALALLEQECGLKAQRIRTGIIQRLSEPGRGRLYKRGNITHRASAPGQGPAVDTGRLRQSIAVVKVGDQHYRIGTNVRYAPLLEFGTRHIAPRPFMRPAAEEEART